MKADDALVSVHSLTDGFGLYGLRELSDGLMRFPKGRRLLVQYVPHAYGWKALNLPFCIWLWSRRKRGDSVWVMFHEVAFPLSRRQPILHNLLGVGTRAMAWVTVRAAERVFVSIPAWEDLLKGFTSARPTTWLPIPSNIPLVDDAASVAAWRNRIKPEGGKIVGHFGTYGSLIVERLRRVLSSLLEKAQNASVLLIGRGGIEMRRNLVVEQPQFARRIYATGVLPATDVSSCVTACDLLIQPYPDGVSSRRTSMMVGLSHARPLITNLGHLSEPFWGECGAVAVGDWGRPESVAALAVELLADEGWSRSLGAAGRRLYDEYFDMRNTIARLKNEA